MGEGQRWRGKVKLGTCDEGESTESQVESPFTVLVEAIQKLEPLRFSVGALPSRGAGRCRWCDSLFSHKIIALAKSCWSANCSPTRGEALTKHLTFIFFCYEFSNFQNKIK